MSRSLKSKLAVYGTDEEGKAYLLERGVNDREAVKIADDFWRETGRTATIVISEEGDTSHEGD